MVGVGQYMKVSGRAVRSGERRVTGARQRDGDRPHWAVADSKGVEMPSRRLNTALAGLVVAAALAAPAAYAMPTDPAAPAVTRDASDVPPPPTGPR